jgi:hypothetical protein
MCYWSILLSVKKWWTGVVGNYFLKINNCFHGFWNGVFSYNKNVIACFLKLKMCRVSASKLYLCYFHIMHTNIIENKVFFSTNQKITKLPWKKNAHSWESVDKCIIYSKLRDFRTRPKFFKNSPDRQKLFLAKTKKYLFYDIEW